MKKLILSLIVMAFASTAAVAQISGNINASATIEAPITVTGGDALEFGTVLPGLNGIVAIDGSGNALLTNADGGALGTFTVTGSNGNAAQLTVIFPANLEFGANNLPFTMDGSDFGRIEGADSADTNFNPDTANQSFTFGDDPVTIKLGGQVSPTSNQAAGTYTGTITLEVQYNI